jgi:hypothetical protein
MLINSKRRKIHIFIIIIVFLSLILIFSAQVFAENTENEIPRSFKIQLTSYLKKIPSLNEAQHQSLYLDIIELIETGQLTTDFVEDYFEEQDLKNLTEEKITDSFKEKTFENYDENKFNTRQLRVKADFRVNLSSETPQTGTMYWVPSNTLGLPDTKLETLKSLIGKPKELQEEIDVLYEALAYIQISEMKTTSGNITLDDTKNNIRWQFPAPAEYAIKNNEANCAAMTNVINYLLKGDYDEVGGLWYHNSFIIGDRRGGHIINYIKEDSKYYFFDALGYIKNRDTYSAPEIGENYSRGHKLGCIHELRLDDKEKTDFKPYIDMIKHYNPNIAFAVLIPEIRHPAIGISMDRSKHDSHIYLSDNVNLNQIKKLYDHPDDPQFLLEKSVKSKIPEDYKTYLPYKNM